MRVILATTKDTSLKAMRVILATTKDISLKAMRVILATTKDTSLKAMPYFWDLPRVKRRHKVKQIKVFLNAMQNPKNPLCDAVKEEKGC